MYLVFSVFSKPNFKNPTGSISASVGRIDSKWKRVTHQAGIYAGEDGYDKIYNSIGLVPNLGVESKGKANSTTQSAISDGILTVDGKEIDTKTINTNTENTLHQLDKIFDKKKIEERQELARLFSKNAFEQLHNWQPTTKEGKVAKSIAHGVIGELAARMAGNAPGSAFKATMTNELLIGEIKKVAKHDPALAQWLSATVGGVVNKVSGESSNSGAATASYATKWNDEGLFHVDRVDLDGISEDNKDLALADLNYNLAQSNRYNINKLREKKKYIRKDHLYSESKGIGAGITDVVGIGFSRGYGIDSEGSSYVTDQVSIGASAFPVQSTTSDTRVLYGEQGFTGGAISISMNTGGGESYSLGPTNITESKTMNVSPEVTISFSYTEKLESEVPSEYVVNDTSVDLSTYTPDQPDGVYSPPPTEPEIRETNDMESLENRIRAIRTQFEIED
ncbi:MAG: hypothetical protein E7C47_05670 [Veillonella sp.]|nr:hypothetical protein [Veillonella sp.]